MEITIRKAKEQDFPELVRLIQEFSLFVGTPEKVSITAAQLEENKSLFHCFVVTDKQNKILGFATCFYAFYSWSGKALYLDDLYVKEAFRNQGLGKSLLYAVIEMAKAQKCRKVRWQVSRWNTQAIGFYKHIGAEIDEVELNCDYTLVTDGPLHT